MFVCGSGAWGFWWIFPLVGGLICLAFLVMAFRSMTIGRGGMCCKQDHQPGVA